jgi:hypothetical protein
MLIKFPMDYSRGGVDGGLPVRIALAKNAIQAWRNHAATGVGAGLLANIHQLMDRRTVGTM